MMMEEEIEKLRELVWDCVSKHLYSSAIFFVDNNANDGDGIVSPPLPLRVYGWVIGVQKGHTVEIFNNFELFYDPSTHSLVYPFLEKKQELY